MPWTEMLLKDLNHLWLRWRNRGKSQAGKRLLVHPHYPSRGATIYRIANELGLEVSNLPKASIDLGVYWEYATYRSEFATLETSAKQGLRVINLHSRNIAKDYLDDCHLKAFGYCTRVDASTHHGAMVEKSVMNAVHDGKLVHGPMEPKPTRWYQRLVDSSQNEREVMDLRIPVIKGEIPLLYCAYRFKEARFVNVPARVTLCVDISSMINETEQNQLINLCDLMGIEFGELDVLRDVVDGRLYVVDANNTPQGPPKHLPEIDKSRALKILASCFESAFLQAR